MTDKECYIGRLFGNERKQIDKTGDELDVKEGDTLYLHRWGNEDEPDQLDGPFTAAYDAGKISNLTHGDTEEVRLASPHRLGRHRLLDEY